MKKLLVFLAIIILIGCSKETCFECTATISVTGMATSTGKSITCGDFTKEEKKQMTKTTTASSTVQGYTATITTRCKEQ